MYINLRELLDGQPSRLRYVMRYSTCRVGHPENVAEHGYYVALYAMLVGQWCLEHVKNNSDRPSIRMGLLLQKAIIHDLEEARSGDFPRPFKYSTPDLRRMLDDAASAAFLQLSEMLLDKNSADNLWALWQSAKDESREGRIVEFCDFLAVLSFMMQEGAAHGNHTIVRHVADMRAYFKKFWQDHEYSFLSPLIAQTMVIMKEVFGE